MIVELNGSRRGGWLFAEGTPYARRSLPPNLVIREFSQYAVSGTELPDGWSIESFVVAPWFGQPGGGTGFRLLDQNGRTGPLLRLIDSGSFTPVGRDEVDALPPPSGRLEVPELDLGRFPEPCRRIVRAWYQWRVIATRGRYPFVGASGIPGLGANIVPLLTDSEVRWGEEEPTVTEGGVLQFTLGGIGFGFFLDTDDKWVVRQRDRNTWHNNQGFLLLEDAQKFLLSLIAEEARTLRGLPSIGTGWYRGRPDCGIELVRYEQDSSAGTVFVRPAGSQSQYLAWMDAWEALRFGPAFGHGYDELHTILSRGIPAEWFVEIG